MSSSSMPACASASRAGLCAAPVWTAGSRSVRPVSPGAHCPKPRRYTGGWRSCARALGRGDDHRDAAVGDEAAVEQVQRLDDPARGVVVLERHRPPHLRARVHAAPTRAGRPRSPRADRGRCRTGACAAAGRARTSCWPGRSRRRPTAARRSRRRCEALAVVRRLPSSTVPPVSGASAYTQATTLACPAAIANAAYWSIVAAVDPNALITLSSVRSSARARTEASGAISVEWLALISSPSMSSRSSPASSSASAIASAAKSRGRPAVDLAHLGDPETGDGAAGARICQARTDSVLRAARARRG